MMFNNIINPAQRRSMGPSSWYRPQTAHVADACEHVELLSTPGRRRLAESSS